MKGDSLEGDAHTPMYNPHILSLSSSWIISFKKIINADQTEKYL